MIEKNHEDGIDGHWAQTPSKFPLTVKWLRSSNIPSSSVLATDLTQTAFWQIINIRTKRYIGDISLQKGKSEPYKAEVTYRGRDCFFSTPWRSLMRDFS